MKTGLQKIKGEVIINHRPAVEGQLIKPGDSIVTGRNSEAIYVVGRDAGKILSVFGKGAKTIQTSTATIGIRGTGCYIEDEGTGAKARTYFCLCYGSVDLTPKAAPQEAESYTTTHHDKPMYIHNDMTMVKMMVPAEVINHTDEELTLLEGLVGRVTPFYGTGKKY